MLKASSKYITEGIKIVLSIIVLCLGAMVIFGWHTHQEALIQVHQAFVPMQYNTALGFLCLGLGLIVYRISPKLTSLFGLLAFLLGGLTLIEYGFFVNLGIDQLFMEHYVSVKTSHLGRMAPNTALCFTFMGIILIISGIEKLWQRELLMLFMSVVVIILGMIALSGYLFNISLVYGWGNLTRMAVHTSLGFILAGTATLLLSFLEIHRQHKKIALLWPLITLFVSAGIVLIFWQTLVSKEREVITQSIKKTTELVKYEIEYELNAELAVYQFLVHRMNKKGQIQNLVKDLGAQLTTHRREILNGLIWVDQNGRQHVLYRQHMLKTLGVDHDWVAKLFLRLPNTKAAEVSFTRYGKNRLMYINMPIFVKNQFKGYLVGIYDIDHYIHNIISDAVWHDHDLRLMQGEDVVFRSKGFDSDAILSDLQNSIIVKMGNELLTMDMWPSDLFINTYTSWMPTLILVIGLLISVTNAFLVLLWRNLRKSRAEAIRADSAKSVFLSSMSHELRTPLNAIIGYAQLLCFDDKTSQKTKENASMIQEAGTHLLMLINDVLDMAKIEAGKMNFSIEAVSMNDVMSACRALVHPYLEKFQVNLEYDEQVGGGVYLKADYFRFKQVMLNLLTNAAKYNKKNGNIVVSLRCLEGNYARIQVTDNGMGIAKENLEHVFKSFARLGAERGHVEGTGIGMVITKSLVELMGGEVGIDSVEGKGTTVWVTLPTMDLAAAETMEGNPKQTAKRGAIIEPSKVQFKEKILLVEDNPANQAIIAEQLKYLGFSCDIAKNGKEGVKHWGGHQYALILMDCHMPIMDGFEAAKEIRQAEKLKGEMPIPIVAFTASVIKEELDLCYKSGMDDTLLKPCELGALKVMLDKWVTHKTVNETVEPPKPEQTNSSVEDSQKNTDLLNYDLEIVKQYVGDQPEIIDRIVNKFKKSAVETISAIKVGIDHENYKQVQSEAHKLKSAAKAVGANELAEICIALEQAAKDKSFPDVQNIGAKLS